MHTYLKVNKTFFFLVMVIIIIHSFWSHQVCSRRRRSITSSEMCSLHLTHPSAHTLGAVDTHTHTHTPGAVDTHTHTPHLEQWTHTHTHHTWSSGQSGEQLGVRCLAQGSHLSRGHNLGLQAQRSIH